MPVLTVESAHALAGACGAMLSISIFYPLDQIRAKMQLHPAAYARTTGIVSAARRLVELEGLDGLYSGLASTNISLGCSSFVYFYALHFVQRLLRAHNFFPGDGHVSELESMLVSAVAGVLNVLLTAPLFVASARIKYQKPLLTEATTTTTAVTATATTTTTTTTQQKKDPLLTVSTTASSSPDPPPAVLKYRGMLQSILTIAREEGVAALWSGTIPSLILVCNPVIQWVVYQRCKALWGLYVRGGLRSPGTGSLALLTHDFFLLGAVAKAAATILTYPLQLSQTLLRTDPSADKRNKQPRYRSTLHCLARVYKDGGLAGLYRGIQAKLWQTVLTAAFMFVAMEELSAAVLSFAGLSLDGNAG